MVTKGTVVHEASWSAPCLLLQLPLLILSLRRELSPCWLCSVPQCTVLRDYCILKLWLLVSWKFIICWFLRILQNMTVAHISWMPCLTPLSSIFWIVCLSSVFPQHIGHYSLLIYHIISSFVYLLLKACKPPQDSSYVLIITVYPATGQSLAHSRCSVVNIVGTH